MTAEPRILIIDDNPQDQKLIQLCLKRAGIDNIAAASTGEGGLSMAESARPHVILIDTLMPDYDGFEVLRRLKERGVGAKTIMMTGCVDGLDAERARALGVDDYVVKTSDCAAIIEAVGNLIGS